MTVTIKVDNYNIMEEKKDSEPKIEGSQIGIKKITGQDQWITIELVDGNVLKFKSLVLKVMKLQSVSPFGEPQYLVQSQTVAVLDNLANEVGHE